MAQPTQKSVKKQNDGSQSPLHADADQAKSQDFEASAKLRSQTNPSKPNQAEHKAQEEQDKPKDDAKTIEILTQQLEVAKTDLLRSLAERENEKNRHLKAMNKARNFAVQGLLEAMIPVLDGMEKGLQAFAQDHDAAAVAQGMVMTHEQLAKVLLQSGVKVIDPKGQAFDHGLHEALSMQPSDEYKPGTVIDVIQKGYQLNGRVVRPARVIVAKTS